MKYKPNMVGNVMAKGTRKRSNTSSKKTATKKKSCKSGSCKAVKSVIKEYAVQPFKPEQVQILKETVNLSNRFAKLINQQQQKYNHMAMSKDYVKRLRDGKVNTPIMKQVAGNIFETIDDPDELADLIEKENEDIEQSIDIVEGQMSHWYDEYVDSLIRSFLMQKQLLQKVLGNTDIKDIKGHYKHATTKEAKKAEEKSFVKQFDAENLTDEDKAEIKKLVKKNGMPSRKSGKENS